MASIGSITVALNYSDGVADAIATLEHIRDDADFRVRALRTAIPAPLDVRRLARAIEDHGDICSRMAVPECASAIAAAYLATDQ